MTDVVTITEDVVVVEEDGQVIILTVAATGGEGGGGGFTQAQADALYEPIGVAQDLIDALIIDLALGTAAQADTADFATAAEGAVAAMLSTKWLGYFTWATRPDATTNAGKQFTATDLAGGGMDFWSDGAYWYPVSRVIWQSMVNIAIGSTINETIAGTFVFPAGILAPRMLFQISWNIQVNNNSNVKTARLREVNVAGNQLRSNVFPSQLTSGDSQNIVVTTATAMSTTTSSNGANTGAVIALTQNPINACTFVVTGQKNAAPSDTLNFLRIGAELVPPGLTS
jgi:hypothetical protein